MALIQLRKRLSEKWVGSPRIHLFHPPPAPQTYIYTHTHTPMLIWFEKISGNITINFSSCKNDYSCLTALCWNSWIYTLCLYRDKLKVVYNLIKWTFNSRHIMWRVQLCKIEIKYSGQSVDLISHEKIPSFEWIKETIIHIGWTENNWLLLKGRNLLIKLRIYLMLNEVITKASQIKS